MKKPPQSPIRPDFPDSPGQNIELQPEKAPAWLRPLVDSMRSGHIGEQIQAELKATGSIDRQRQAAVLMVLSGSADAHELPEDAEILLIHRSPTLRSHSGQMAFPGGRVDPEDETVVDCAMREAWEETGLDRHSVTPLAELPEVHIHATGYPVHPILAYWHDKKDVAAIDPAETDEVLSVPIRKLLDPKVRFRVSMGNRWHGPAFDLDGYVVWGFTGALLNALFQHAGWEIPWDTTKVVPLEEAIGNSRNGQHNGAWD